MNNLIEKLKSGISLKSPIFWARFFAYTIPLTFLFYVLYINFLPFGYNKNFIIKVGSKGDTDSSKEFYLGPSKDLSEATTSPDGSTYRTLNGFAYASFNPKVALKNTEVTVSVESNNVLIIPPVIDFNPDNIIWDYSWDLTKGIPKDLTGNAFMFDGEANFNGNDTRLELVNSADKFENGPFTLYAEWTPKDSFNNGQQIVGHFNWELWQNKDNVEFRIGKVNDTSDLVYSARYPITSEFFNKKHSAIAIYDPSENGYIDFFVDGVFAGRTYIKKDKIRTNYGNQNLSFGWTPHNYGSNKHLLGIIYRANITSGNILPFSSETSFRLTGNNLKDISIVSAIPSEIKNITLNAIQK